MKTFYRIFGGKCRERALLHYALISFLLISTAAISQPTASFSGGGHVCQGQTTDLLINISGGTAPWRIVYALNGVQQPTINNILTSPYTLTTGTEGEYKIDEVYDGNGDMGSGTGDPAIVLIDPLPEAAGMISGNNNVCQSTGNVVYSVSPIHYATGYSWSVPAGATIVSGNNTNSITVNYSASSSSGNISVYGTNSCGNGASSSLYITVLDPPASAGLVSGSSTVCQGQNNVIYSVNPIANAINYEWNLPAGAIITSGSNSNVITVSYSTSSTSGNIRVRGNNGCGNGAWSPDLVVTVNPLPADPGAISGSANVCAGQTGVIYNVPVIGNTNGYEWQLPSGATISSGTNTNQITVSFSAVASSGNIIVRGTNGCGAGQWSAAFAVNVNSLPVASGDISGFSTVCQNQSGLVYSIAPVAFATSYEWQYPAGFTLSGPSNGTSITLNTTVGAVSGIIRVRGLNACGNGAWSSDFSVIITNSPTANAGVDANICESGSVNLSGNATNYSSVSWSSSGDGSFSNSGILNPVYTPGSFDISTGNAILTLTANGNGSCTPATDFMVVTLSDQPLANAGPDGSICYSASSYVLSGTASNHASVLWQALDGTGTFGNPSNLNTSYFPSAADRAQGYVTIQLSANPLAPCSVPATDIMVINISSAPVVNAGADASSCGTTSVNLNGSATFYSS